VAGLAWGFGVNISLSVKDVNIILASLGKNPYEIVFETIHKIQEQAKAQAE
jgi:hypothetical protein